MADTPAQVLTARLRALVDQHTVSSAAIGWPPMVHDAYWDLVGVLVDDGVDLWDAKYAATQAMIETDKPIRECVAEQQTAKARKMRKTRRS